MKLDKNKQRLWIVEAILLIVYHVIVLSVPFAKNTMFWVAYLFTLISILAQVYIFQVSFQTNGDAKNSFYGFPIARLGVIYLAVQLILGFLGMVCSKFCPVWIGVILYVVILGAAAIGLITTQAVKEEIEKQDIVHETKISAMRTIQSQANQLTCYCKEPEVSEAVMALAEQFRYSDPVSSPALEEMEKNLADSLTELKQVLETKNQEEALLLCKKTERLLAERNRLCKLNKGIKILNK